MTRVVHRQREPVSAKGNNAYGCSTPCVARNPAKHVVAPLTKRDYYVSRDRTSPSFFSATYVSSSHLRPPSHAWQELAGGARETTASAVKTGGRNLSESIFHPAWSQLKR
ncbi:unnamed protein product, partial [Rangifer tarandus platyrhynchus]